MSRTFTESIELEYKFYKGERKSRTANTSGCEDKFNIGLGYCGLWGRFSNSTLF